MEENIDFDFCMEWVNELLKSLGKHYSDDVCADLMKPCGNCHLKTV